MAQEHEQNDLVRNRAHQIWETAGKPDGEHESHWEQAILETASESPLDQPPGSIVPKDPAVQKKRAAPKGA